VQIVLQNGALFELTTRDFENVDAPANPGVRLGLGGVEQMRQRARLHGQGEFVHDLDAFAAQSLSQHPIEQSLDLRHHLRFLRPLEEGLGDGSVVGVLGRIGLDGKLPHGAHVLLGWNRHAERNVGAEGLPILCRFTHVFVPQNHRDVFAMKRTLHHA